MDIFVYLGIFLLVDFLLLGYILFRNSKKKFRRADLDFFALQWGKIRAQSDAKHALLDADKLLNVVLSKKGFGGGVGDQLQKAGKLFTNVDDVWTAHKLRNRIAHELNMQLSLADRDRTLRIFEKALKDLRAL